MPRPHLSDHQKLAQARAEIARLRKAAEAKAEPLTDATRRKLEGELMKVLAARATGCQGCASVVGRDRAPAPVSQVAECGDIRQGEDAQEDARLTLLHPLLRRLDDLDPSLMWSPPESCGDPTHDTSDSPRDNPKQRQWNEEEAPSHEAQVPISRANHGTEHIRHADKATDQFLIAFRSFCLVLIPVELN
jgi:hypothetical protein